MGVRRALARFLALEGIDDPRHAPLVRAAFAIAGVAMLLRIVFWVYTHRYWEDALITCLHSENFVRGLGLTHFRPGEPPLHGFTSPLSVLVPLMGDLMHLGFGVEFLKLVSIPAGGLIVLYLLAFSIHPRIALPAPLALVLMGYAAWEHHQILFGMAGMETQLAALILAMSFYYSVAWKPIPLGVSLGLCILARPDYAFWTIIVGICGLFHSPRSLPKVVATALALYLPWIIFTALYYGSPIPNTIVAKGLGNGHWWDGLDQITFFDLKRQLWVRMSEQLHIMLGPTFGGHGAGIHLFFANGPESPIANLMFAFAVFGGLAMVARRQWALFPVAAFAVVYSLYYVYLVPVVATWYKVPYALSLLIVSIRGVQAAGSLVRSPRWRMGVLSVFAAAYLGCFVGVLPLCFQTERQIQRDIENAVRKPAALYVGAHIKPDEAVGGEPLGYMSYYSHANVYDWPGLASRTVTEWVREHPDPKDHNLESMLKSLRPEYLLLRDLEVRFFFKDTSWLEHDYHVAAEFHIDPEAAKKIHWLDRNIDTDYKVYQRNDVRAD